MENFIPLANALKILLNNVISLSPEVVSLSDAVGRVLYDDVVARKSLPPFNRVMMDGYALRSGDTRGTSRVPLEVVGDLPAGKVFNSMVGRGCCVLVATGAPLPAGADTVVMRENVVASGGLVVVPGEMGSGTHIDPEGADIRAGERVVSAGAGIAAGEAAMLAAQGYSVVRVFRVPRVAILSTGDELVEVDQGLGPGKIRDSNRYMLMAACKEVGATPVLGTCLHDEVETTMKALLTAGEDADLVLSTGGTCAGDHDVMRRALLEIADELLFHGLRIKSGKPTIAVLKGGVPYIALPGNPNAALLDFELLVKPVLKKMMGLPAYLPPFVWASLQGTYCKKPLPDRSRYVWAVAGYRDAWQVTPIRDGRITALMGYNALVEIPAGHCSPVKGDKVKTILTKCLGNYSERKYGNCLEEYSM